MLDNSKKPENKLLIIALVVYIVGVVTLLPVAAIFFPEMVQSRNIVAAVGIPFLLLGLGCISSQEDRLLGIGCTMAGVGMICSPLLLKRTSEGKDIDLVESGIKLGGMAVVVMGLVGVICSGRALYNKINRCTMEIEAVVRDTRGVCEEGQQTTCFGFEYYYCGCVYTVKDEVSREGEKYVVGEIVKLKIDPENPENFYRSQPGLYSLAMAFGFAAVLVGILIISMTTLFV